MYTLENRPSKFSEVIGNDITRKEFQKRAKDKSYPQVMFFLGDSGTGKTTLSYIVSALINCHNPTSDNEPCGTCPSCVDIFNERFGRDVIRINGGNLGKDGVNDIETKISFSPMYEKNKIVILEEGHLISNAGKEQALLMLEKKRKNVYFIILSTEKDKFSKTILDRGQVYSFKAISNDIISKHLLTLLDKYDPDCKVPESFIKEGLFVIAENSKGSVRKAIEDFERCLFGEIYTTEAIEKELSYISEKKMYEILNLLINKNKLFFEEVSKIELEDYFFYSWKILTNSRVVKLTIKDINDASWQDKSSLKYCDNPNFSSLISTYEKIALSNNKEYFNNNMFFNYLIDFFQTNSIPLIKKDNINNNNSGRKTR